MGSEKAKTIFFWTLVALFFASASFLILYSFGYQFNSERGIFIHGGSVTIKSNPQDVEVIVHGHEDITKRTNRLNNSYHIDRIPPGEYLIEVKADGFESWSKKAIINSGISTEFWNVSLVKSEYEKTRYDAENIENFYISPKQNMAAYTKSIDGIFSVNLLDLENNESKEIFSSKNISFTEDKQENIEWSPDGERIVVPVKRKDDKFALILNIEDDNIVDISEMTETRRISNTRWHPEDDNKIYFMSKRNLYLLNTESEEVKLIAERISSYDISEKEIFFFQLPGGIVFKTNLEGDIAPTQITKSSPLEMEDSEYKLTAYDEKRVTLINKSGDLYIYNKTDSNEYFQILSYGAKSSQFSNDGKKLLYWTANEIYVYFIREWETQPRREENEKISVTRLSSSIGNVQWSRDYEHILFSFNGSLKTIELDHRDKRNIFNILSYEIENPKIINDIGERKIYFTDIDNNGDVSLFSIEYPERNGLLTFR